MKSLEVYSILVKEHEGMLQSYLLGIVRDPGLAEDIAQETFIKAYHKLSSLKNKQAFGSWLRAIGRNTAFVELKRRGVEISTEPEVMQGMEDVFNRFSRPGDVEPWEERMKLVESCFKKLPEKMLTSCRMHYFEDKATKDIASALNVSLAAVLKRLERSREAIRTCVEKQMLADEAP